MTTTTAVRARGTQNPGGATSRWWWVTCERASSLSASYTRHLIGRGRTEGTTLCGATGLGEGVWRRVGAWKGNCQTCTAAAEAAG